MSRVSQAHEAGPERNQYRLKERQHEQRHAGMKQPHGGTRGGAGGKKAKEDKRERKAWGEWGEL